MTQEKTVERTTTTTNEPMTPHETVETTTVRGGRPHGDEEADGAVAGGAAGAVGGALVGGPVGAVIGGAIGATAGATAGLADEESKDHDDQVVTQEVTRPSAHVPHALKDQPCRRCGGSVFQRKHEAPDVPRTTSSRDRQAKRPPRLPAHAHPAGDCVAARDRLLARPDRRLAHRHRHRLAHARPASPPPLASADSVSVAQCHTRIGSAHSAAMPFTPGVAMAGGNDLVALKPVGSLHHRGPVGESS